MLNFLIFIAVVIIALIYLLIDLHFIHVFFNSNLLARYLVTIVIIIIVIFGFIKLRDGLLMYAIEHEQAVLVKQVMFIGANVNHANVAPLQYAVKHEQLDIVTILLQSHKTDITAKDYSGNTALMYSIQNKNITQLLIDKGADINAKNNKGETALKLAKTYNQQGTIELLLKYGAQE